MARRWRDDRRHEIESYNFPQATLADVQHCVGAQARRLYLSGAAHLN
jgi:hypothetical protein